MATNDGTNNGRAAIRAFERVPLRALGWLWPGVVPAGKLTVISGDPNLGKSFLTLDLAARTTTGDDWPHGTRNDAIGKVLLLAAEDDPADTIRPRLEIAGARLRDVHFFAGVDEGRDAEGPRPFSLLRDLPLLADRLQREQYRLVIVDPVSAYLDGVDINGQQEVRRVLTRLSRLAERSGAAVVAVSHHRKKTDRGPAVYRTLGSLAFTAVARAVWSVCRGPADVSRRLLLPVKMNIAPDPQGLAYRIVQPGRVAWEPEPVSLTADELSEESLADSDLSDRVKQAGIWLQGFLLKGPQTSTAVKSAARAAGIACRPLWSAKKSLRVPAYREGGAWKWCLPEDYIPQVGEFTRAPLPPDAADWNALAKWWGEGVTP